MNTKIERIAAELKKLTPEELKQLQEYVFDHMWIIAPYTENERKIMGRYERIVNVYKEGA